jgi:hypothetical protein
VETKYELFFPSYHFADIKMSSSLLSSSQRWSPDSGHYSLGADHSGTEETASTAIDTDDTISLPESLRKEYHNLCAKVVEEKMSYLTRMGVDHIDQDEDDVISEMGSTSSMCGSDAEKEEEEEEEEEEADSGLESSSSDNISDGDVRLANDCMGQKTCFCTELKEWLARMSDRRANLTDLDEHYRDNTEEKKSLSEKNFANCNFDPYPTLASESYRYAGERDKFGRIHGRGTVYFPNGRKFAGSYFHGARSGQGELFEREGARILAGKYVCDKLHGLCEISTNEGGVLEMTFKGGVANGPARRFSPLGYLQWMGRYKSGEPFGLSWHSTDGEGWYVGTSNRCGRMTGADVVYLYPDLHTALVGSWNNDVMKSARLSRVVGLTKRDGYVYPSHTPCAHDEKMYTWDVSGYSQISSTPHQPDPYEASMVRCKVSSVTGGGEGLYAARNLPVGTIVSFYNGIRFHDCHVSRNK